MLQRLCRVLSFGRTCSIAEKYEHHNTTSIRCLQSRTQHKMIKHTVTCEIDELDYCYSLFIQCKAVSLHMRNCFANREMYGSTLDRYFLMGMKSGSARSGSASLIDLSMRAEKLFICVIFNRKYSGMLHGRVSISCGFLFGLSLSRLITRRLLCHGCHFLN